MAVAVAAVRVVVGLLDGHEVEMAVPHARFSREARSERAHGCHRSLQDGALEAVLVIEVHVQGRDHEIVAGVLALGESLGEVAFVVVVDVRETRHAVAAWRAILRFAIEAIANEVAHRFTAVPVAPLLDQPVEGRGKFIVEGDRDALHEPSLLHTGAPMRAVALCVIALLLAFVVAPPVFEATVLLAALHDAAHVLTFALIAVFLCVLIEPRGTGLVMLFLVAGVLAVGTEAAQPYFAGAGAIEVASIGDVARDLLGALIGTLAWRAHHRQRRRLWIPAAALLAAGLAPLVFTGWAYVQRAMHPDVVWDVSRATWQVFLEPSAEGRYERDARYLRFTASSDSFAGFSIREPPPDWRGYAALRVALANPGTVPIRINVRIDDRSRDTEYEDRFNRERVVPAGAPVVWRIPLDEIERGPEGRRLDLSDIRRLVIFLSPGSRGASFDLGSVRLERAP